MGQLIRATDWSQTALGPLPAWPASLRLASHICLHSRLPMCVWWGPQFISLYNDAYIPILGKRHPDALGKPAQDVWAEIWPEIGPQLRAVITDGGASPQERVPLVVERYGFPEIAHFTWSPSPIPSDDEAGGVGGVLCVVTEETARVTVERERDRLAEQRQLALDAARMGWWHYDPQTRIATFDHRYEEIFGVSGHQKPNDEILARIHPDDLARVWASVEAALDPRDPRPFTSEYRVRHDDGSYRWVEAHGLAAFDGDGPGRRATSFVGTVTDVTDRKRGDDQARVVLESITDAFFAVSRDWRFTYTNPQADQILGRAPGELLGRVLWDAYPGLIGSEFERVYRRVAEARAPLDLTSYYPDHDRWYEHIPPFGFLRRGPQLRRMVRAASAELVRRAFGTGENVAAAWKVIGERRKEIAKAKKAAYARGPEFAVDRLAAAHGARKVTCDADVVPPVKVMSGDEFDELAGKDADRAERAKAVLASSAAARDALLVPQGYAGLATNAGIVATRVAAEAAPPASREIAIEAEATGDDLAALREVR